MTSRRRRRPEATHPSPWTLFVARHGWRAYALPILPVVSVWALLHTKQDAGAQPTAARPAHHTTVARHVTPPARRTTPALVRTTAARTTAPVARPTTPTVPAKAAPTTAPATAAASPCTGNTASELVLVSISAQHAWMCAGAAQVYATAVTTGALTDDMQTPTGTWHVQDKQTDRYLVGPGYRDWVKYWVPFNGDFGFHDASWQTFPFGSSQWRTDGSHGCVHLPTPAMSWLYSWVQVGATVTVEA